MSRFVLALALLPIAVAAVAADWDVDTLVALESVDDFQVAPGGRRAVWTQRSLAEDGKAYTYQLFIAELAADGPAPPRRLTWHEADSKHARFSADGARLAFLSARGEGAEAQVWLLGFDGGEARALTDHAGGVDDFAWLPDGRLLILGGEGETRRELDREAAGDAAIVVEDPEHVAPRRLFLFDPADGSTRRLGAADEPVLEFSTSPDGRWAVAVHQRSLADDHDYRTPPAVRLWDLASGESRELLPPELRASGFVWDLKSEGVYFRRPIASSPDELFVAVEGLGYAELARGDWRPVPLGWGPGLGWWGPFASEKGLLVELLDGVRNRLAHLERDGEGWERRDLPRPERGVEMPLALGPDGRTLLLARSHASRPPRFLVGTLKKDELDDERPFLVLNPVLDTLPMPRSEPFWWVGAEGDTVEGLLHYPLDYDDEADERHPLIVMIHGGPSDVDQDRFLESWGGSPGLFAARGAFVLRPNYHGSAGYGLDWLESIKARYYELELEDIELGVDALLGLGLVDASRMGVQGWSNGAILGLALCLETGERFRALDAGAGDVNWSSDYGNCAFGAGFGDAYLGGPPWERPQAYVAKSPLFRLDELRVPTLVTFGAEDTTVPAEQGWELFRGLRRAGGAPVRFLLFPGEGHSLMSPVARRRQMREQLDWFDRWLFAGSPARNEALLADSPLDRALRLGDAARYDGAFGEIVDAVLAPELLRVGALLVGRFEVTRAQWAAYSGEPAQAGRENLPVTGVTAEAARAYCAWLSAQLGLSCRLPSAKEWDALAAAAAEDENTLAWWAGYPPNREDALRLAERVELLEAERSLLRPVGSHSPSAGSALYDLGGNAAEWVILPDGRAEARGLCAVTARDAFGPTPAPPADYVGLRVVATPVGEGR